MATFYIYDKTTEESVGLKHIEELYCEFMGIEPHNVSYGSWFHLLENVLYIHGSIADTEYETYLSRSLDIKHYSRTIDFFTIAQLLIVDGTRILRYCTTFEDFQSSLQHPMKVAEFFWTYKDEYYIKYSF